MNYYNCTVRPGGSLFCEVPKYNLSAPEVIALRKLHGPDSVIGIEHVEDKPLEQGGQAELRAELTYRYGAKVVGDFFGDMYQDLPSRLPDHAQFAKRAKGKPSDAGAVDARAILDGAAA